MSRPGTTNQKFIPVPVLKLTSNLKFARKLLKKSQEKQLQLLKKESKENGFQVIINSVNLEEIDL